MVDQSPILRTGTAADLDSLEAIETAAFQSDRLSRRSLKRHLANRSARLVVAEDDGVIAGYALILTRRTSPLARLHSIAVGPGHAGRGIGGLLLAAAEHAARHAGKAGLRLEVRPDNPRAIGLYERRGYQRTGVRPAFYADGAPALLYRRAFGEDALPASSPIAA
ncbi:GNAT family N-acetyltransferase [Propylenella binzhouense]|uniref:GNAT family N-acetyltransferase n=1 Tax=Propylenella binzhouense TaxID=2555902 RepID=A0A964T2G2_9HYPH|nr:GNAT family N-acetyltransferase [Propylenella binzhouense]MYZ47206.1 GNAT family N-acetyltransferase [Propylenella binzhouense]